MPGRWRHCAGVWTACHWRWSWPRRASCTCRHLCCWVSWKAVWPCSATARATCRPASRRCTRRSPGAMSCSPQMGRCSCAGWQCSRGGTLEAVAAVCRMPVGLPPLEGDVLARLVDVTDHSLLTVEEQADGTLRFGLLETIRAYAWERAEAAGEAAALRRAHAAYFLALAEGAEPALKGAEQAVWLERLEREHDNLRAALRWAVESAEGEMGLRLGGALWRFWYVRGHLSEGR